MPRRSKLEPTHQSQETGAQADETDETGTDATDARHDACSTPHLPRATDVAGHTRDFTPAGAASSALVDRPAQVGTAESSAATHSHHTPAPARCTGADPDGGFHSSDAMLRDRGGGRSDVDRRCQGSLRTDACDKVVQRVPVLAAQAGTSEPLLEHGEVGSSDRRDAVAPRMRQSDATPVTGGRPARPDVSAGLFSGGQCEHQISGAGALDAHSEDCVHSDDPVQQPRVVEPGLLPADARGATEYGISYPR